MAGHYANFANVSHSDYEFTITFARVDHEVDEAEVPGVVVSRVNLSPRFMRELIDAMEDNFSKWQTREGIRELPELALRGQANARRLTGLDGAQRALSRSLPPIDVAACGLVADLVLRLGGRGKPAVAFASPSGRRRFARWRDLRVVGRVAQRPGRLA